MLPFAVADLSRALHSPRFSWPLVHCRHHRSCGAVLRPRGAGTCQSADMVDSRWPEVDLLPGPTAELFPAGAFAASLPGLACVLAAFCDVGRRNVSTFTDQAHDHEHAVEFCCCRIDSGFCGLAVGRGKGQARADGLRAHDVRHRARLGPRAGRQVRARARRTAASSSTRRATSTPAPTRASSSSRPTAR